MLSTIHSTSSKSVLSRLSASEMRGGLTLLISLAVAACGSDSNNSPPPPQPPAPTVQISVTPTTIAVGQSATVTWTSNAANCTATGSWSGSQAVNGMQVVTPTATGNFSYTLTCAAASGGGGGAPTTAVQATLTVDPPTSYTRTDLVSDVAGTAAKVTDPNLLNPWGLVFAPTAPVWIANNHAQANKDPTSTLYDGTGKIIPLVVDLPPNGAVTFDPTGIVFNGTTDFKITKAGNTAPAPFIFTGEGGMIGGWAKAVDAANEVTMYIDTTGAVYKGLALAANGGANFLYATDFHNGKVDVFDATYIKQTTSATHFQFVDPNLPAGYAPFGIAAFQNGANGATQIYVTYAPQLPPDNHDNGGGPGQGIIDIYDTNGTFIKRLVSTGGALNAPWGLALAPNDFGLVLSNALLVSNFGDGTINGYDPATGAFLGTIKDATGAPFSVVGLWGIAFGNDALNQPHNTLFFTAGLANENDGVYGRIDKN